MYPNRFFPQRVHFLETIFSLLAFRRHFCFPWEGQGKDIVPNTFCGQRLVYWGKTTSAHPEWHFELCLGSPDLLFYCNGIALQPVPAYWVLRLSPLQFKQVWHSDKLFSFVLGHKMSPKNLPKCNVLWLGNAWVGKGNAGLNIFDWLIFTLSRWINYVFCNSLAIPYTRQTQQFGQFSVLFNQ